MVSLVSIHYYNLATFKIISYVYNMGKNQLFKKFLSDELFYRVLNCFGFDSLDDKRSITREFLRQEKCVEKIISLKPELEKYYLPCKARTYLNGLNEKNIITILRQILKTKNYTLISSEKYIRGEKFISYRLDNYSTKIYNPIVSKYPKNTPITISFT